MSVYDVPIKSLDGTAGVLADQKGKVTLLVNVASFCGLTPQYEGLEKLYERYGDQGFSVVGIPCNQFGAQEPNVVLLARRNAMKPKSPSNPRWATMVVTKLSNTSWE